MDDRTPARLIELACALRAEQPARTAARIERIIVEVEGSAPSARAIARHLAAAGLPWKGGALPARALGRFEADRPNELWTADALHGPVIAGHKTYLFCFLEHLPDPHLTGSSPAFSLDAHHDGLQPTQLQGGLAPTPVGRRWRASNPPSLAQHRLSEGSSTSPLLQRS